ncbi:serine protease [Salibacteraceae bacterium]|nr:serine protease [Salibacteraceae bacterium]
MKILLSLFLSAIAISSFSQDATGIYNKTVGSTVTIETNNGLGSGFFVAPNIIATNYHVIEGATEASCYLNNTITKYKIEGYLAADQSVDLILLKVPSLNKPALPMAPEAVTPGQQVYVIGSPKGLPATISDGIVSGMRDFAGYKLIQMTAPISPGSSGGPVMNSKGQLIGISVSQLTEGQNLNFAIPKSYLELLMQFKKDEAIPISTLYSSSSGNSSNNDVELYEEDKTYDIGVYMTDKPELTLDYLAHFSNNSCFYFTYDMSNVNMKNQTIYMEDYRLVDLETGEIYYGRATDLSSQENSRVIYKGTKSRFKVCFDLLPARVRKFSLMEGECSPSSFCFYSINLGNYSTTNNVNWRLYQNNENEGTVSFYTKQNIGHIKIYIGDIYFGTITKYFSDPYYTPSCGDTGDAMVTVRLEVGTYRYTAICGNLKWTNTFTVTREGCNKLYFTK